MSGFSRRGFLQALAVSAGAAAGTRLAGGSFIGNALAAGSEPTSVVIIHFIGGYNSIFASAKELQGNFGVTAGNYTVLGNGLSVDNTYANSMSAFTKAHMASVGVKHNITAHDAAQAAMWSSGNNNAALVLANAMGGNASIKAAVVGGAFDKDIPRGSVNGISLQNITDMQSTVDALGDPKGPRIPDRGIQLAGMTGAQGMSQNALTGSPSSLVTLGDGYKAAIDTLKLPAKTFDLPGLQTAYSLGSSTAVSSFKSKLAAAELMIKAGTNVVSLFDTGGWDTHGDTSGTVVRNKMTSYVLDPLNVFLNRMVADTTRNVVVAMIGDFARSLPGSNHQPNLSATVIGKYVKQGTTGKVNADVAVAANTPGIQGFWSYLGAVTKAPTNPFGANQHASLLLG